MARPDEGIELIAGPDDAGRRLDKVLRVVLGDRRLSEIYAALRKGRIRVNGSKAEPELRLSAGDRLFIHTSLRGSLGLNTARIVSPSDEKHKTDEELDSIADILILATRDLIFVNKPRGELSQGSAFIEGRIREALAQRSASSLSFMPGPLHRLDRNTTGILAFPRSAEGGRAFTSLIRQRKLIKRYLALVDGEVPAAGEWRDRVTRDGVEMKSSISDDGDQALAFMRPLLRSGGRSLVLIELHTGLTHQIRVQASSRGLPLSGDAKYGGSPFAGGYILHALSIEFPEPPFSDLPRIVRAPLPDSALRRLGAIFGRSELLGNLERADGI
jgi:23S rRNA pseudouridine955/2504/2580 synthase